MSTYWELLKHPRWQRKSAETKIRAGWVCQVCGRDDVTLEAHHGFYAFGRDPWEYPDESLFCLCKPCHKRANLQRKQMIYLLGHVHPRKYACVIPDLRRLVAGRARGFPESAESRARHLHLVK